MLFFDQPLERRKDARILQPPPVVDTGWRPPSFWPNLDNAIRIGIDTETKDLGLQDHGPGWGRRQGHIVGVSLAAEDRQGNRGKWYWPIRHEFGDIANFDPANVLDYVRYAVGNANQRKIGQNLTYDMGYLADEGVYFNGPIDDVMFGEALLDSDSDQNLDAISTKYDAGSKKTNLLYPWIRAAYPNTAEKYLRREIYRSPVMLVGPYAEDDAYLPLNIWHAQQPLINREQLDYVYRLECDLIPLMIEMRRQGVRVDLDYFAGLLEELETETRSLYQQARETFGVDFFKTSSGHVGPLLEQFGMKVPRTSEGKYSVEKEWLGLQKHPFADAVLNIREHEKICQTFIRSYIFKQNLNGRLFPQFHQLRTEDNGTMLGRFASSDPNLQNIPSRTKLGKRVRGGFVPNHNHMGWRKFDFSQIHYRLLANFAVDDGDGSAEALRQTYIRDRKTDYHMNVYRNVAPFMGWSQDYTLDEKGEFNEEIKLRRRPIKNVNFGLLYGQSPPSLAYKSGMTEAQADEFFDAYHKGAPYVKPTMKDIEREAQSRGYVTTLCGRRIRFNLWEPRKRNWDNPATPLPYEMAYSRYGADIIRAFGYRAVNYKFQGSEPDIMKSAMRECYRSGVFNVTGYPLITVHDELDFSVPDDSPEMRQAFDFIQYTMENTIKLRIPIFVDESNGPSWGKAD
jgi:DNA polymerase I-like protein with 3'-5' exonuclease and polymerase domains